MNSAQKSQLKEVAKAIRGVSIDAIEAANSGHPGLPLGCAEIAAYLFGYAMRFNPKNPGWLNRDRFILSAGHGSMLLYAALHLAGYDYTLKDIQNFRQLKSKTPGHPEYGHEFPGVETTTGPLGQGIANAVGMALGHKIMAAQFGVESERLLDARLFVLVGDGCMMEGVASEASSLAGHLRLDNLIVIYDANDVCLDGPTSECFSEDVGKRYEAYGWQALRINGHDLDEIHTAVETAKKTTGKPTLIVAKTTIGLGAPTVQGTAEAHGKVLGAEEAKAAKAFHKIPAEPLFYVPEAVTQFFKDKQKEFSGYESDWNDRFKKWADTHPEKANHWQICLKKELPSDLTKRISEIEMPDNIPTRKSSNMVLQVLNEQLPFLVGGSADLSGSDNTWMKKGGMVAPGRYAGHNIKYGVREFAMGAMSSGLALQGMMLPFCGTFLTFSDYMRNAVRLAALMNCHVIYQWTHDSIALGEDGPTHQPVEHLAALRVIPNLTVIRPADHTEVKGAWDFAIRHNGPVALILTRLGVPNLKNTQMAAVSKGAYILKEASRPSIDHCLLATGSEVSLAVQAAEELEKSGVSVRVVSFPSFELFDAQPKAYQEAVLGTDVGQYWSIEAQTSFGWHKYIGRGGHAIAVDTFGASAPQKDVLKHFGFTVDQIVAKIQKTAVRTRL